MALAKPHKLQHIYDLVGTYGVNARYNKYVAPLLLAFDAALCGVIIQKVAYTEIDWQAYMQQIAQIAAGERNYTKISGGTGPLVYPAVHVYIYGLLYKLTSNGTDIRLAQSIFAGVYLVSLAAVMACYRRAKAPPFLFPLLVLSKRLHSIYLLRCFNDGIAVMFLWFAIYCFQRRQFTIGTVLYSLGLGVKMALLLVLPALAVVITMDRGIYQAFIHMVLVVQQQALLGTPFILAYPVEYFTRAFEISRVFMYKWTVNWRFVSEETFLSKPFALALLALHAGTLIFFAVTRWIHPANRPVSFWVQKLLAKKEPLHGIQRKVAARVHGQYTLTTILTANAIGILFARSLHYQFYAYLAWSTPYLLWRGGFHPVIIYALWAAQELAWNVYPSTNLSSMVVVGVLALTVSRVWEGTKYDEYSAVTTASWRDNDN